MNTMQVNHKRWIRASDLIFSSTSLAPLVNKNEQLNSVSRVYFLQRILQHLGVDSFSMTAALTVVQLQIIFVYINMPMGNT